MIAYLIVAHHEPDILRRLVLSLSAEWSRFFIHIDKKVDVRPFVEALADVPDVTFVEARVPVYWGGWSQVRATLSLIDAAVMSSHPFSRFVLLSGVCHPVKTNREIRDTLLNSRFEYMNAYPMPNEKYEKPLTRLTQWYFEGGDRMSGFKARCIRRLNRLAISSGLTRSINNGLGELTPYAGSNWWALTNDAIDLIQETIKMKPNMLALYKYSLCPDESFFQTIIANSRLHDRIKPGLTFTDWSNPHERPAYISNEHLPKLLNQTTTEDIMQDTSPILFARKFSSKNLNLLDEIDKTLSMIPFRLEEVES